MSPLPSPRPSSGTSINDVRPQALAQPPQQLPPPTPTPPEPTEIVVPDYVDVITKVINGASTKLYSLKPPPSWPPLPSDLPSGRNFKLLFDPALDRDHYGKYSEIIQLVHDAISKSANPEDKDSKENQIKSDLSERLKGKSKGRELLYRYNGETLPGESPAVPKDPRKAPGFKRANKIREDYYIPTYQVREFLYMFYNGCGSDSVFLQHDVNSPGPPPATTVLILHLPVLVPNAQIRRHFSIYGKIMSFDPEIDRSTGAALGIVAITFSTHEEAKKCVTNEDGKKFGEAAKGLGLGIVAGLNGEQEMRVVLDGEGRKVKEVLKEIEERKRKELEEKKRREKEKEAMLAANVSGSASVRESNSNATQMIGQTSTPSSWRNQQAGSSSYANPMRQNVHPHQPNAPRGAPPSGPSSLFRARGTILTGHGLPTRPNLSDSFEGSHTAPRSPYSSESTPLIHHTPSLVRDRYRQTASRHFAPNFSQVTPISASPRASSRSPSPGPRRPGQSFKDQHEIVTDRRVMEELVRNGFDHVRIDAAQLGSSIREEDVRSYFDGLKVDKVNTFDSESISSIVFNIRPLFLSGFTRQ